MPEHDMDRGYLLDNQQSEAGIRFGALSELFDPGTFRHIDQLGIAAGMRCWEVGAGGPSVPLGLAGRVGPAGTVMAADIDAYFPITSSSCAVLEAATVRQIRSRLVGEGLATGEEIDRHLANVATGRLDLATAPMISAWGRRP